MAFGAWCRRRSMRANRALASSSSRPRTIAAQSVSLAPIPSAPRSTGTSAAAWISGPQLVSPAMVSTMAFSKSSRNRLKTSDSAAIDMANIMKNTHATKAPCRRIRRAMTPEWPTECGCTSRSSSRLPARNSA